MENYQRIIEYQNAETMPMLAHQLMCDTSVEVSDVPVSVLHSLLPSNQHKPVTDFVYQLVKMLAENKYPNVISWHHGEICVHDPPTLANTVLHQYFRHNNFASFQRQMNYFGFRKRAGKSRLSPCTYYHSDTTNELQSLFFVKRKSRNNKAPPSASTSGTLDAEESFYCTDQSPREEEGNSILSHDKHNSNPTKTHTIATEDLSKFYTNVTERVELQKACVFTSDIPQTVHWPIPPASHAVHASALTSNSNPIRDTSQKNTLRNTVQLEKACIFTSNVSQGREATQSSHSRSSTFPHVDNSMYHQPPQNNFVASEALPNGTVASVPNNDQLCNTQSCDTSFSQTTVSQQHQASPRSSISSSEDIFSSMMMDIDSDESLSLPPYEPTPYDRMIQRDQRRLSRR